MIRILKALPDMLFRLLLSGVDYGRRKGVKIGSDCRIYIKSWGSEPFLVEIGNRVTITSGVKILTHDGATWLVRGEGGVRYQRYRGVRIGNDVFVGVNAIIMPGITIGNRVVIGSGSIVTRDVPDNSVVVGNPAKIVRSFDEYAASIRASEVLDSEISHVKDYRERVMLALKLVEDE